MNREFHYRIGWRVHSAHPGFHAGSLVGGDVEFHGHAPLLAAPDPRNLDVRATLADPFGRLMVKTFRQRAAIPVYLLADLSASMGFEGHARKINLLAEFATALAYSSYRTGDPFGLLACDEQIRWDLSLPLRRHKGLPAEFGEHLRHFQPTSPHANGLFQSAAQIGRRRALIFLLSDFHLPLRDIETLLDGLAHHDIVPVVLWDGSEYDALPDWRLVELRDPETGARRRLLLRPRLRQAIVDNFRRRREALTGLCRRYGREPFFLIDRFDADAMTRYFYDA